MVNVTLDLQRLRTPVLVYTDVNLLGKNINITSKNKEPLLHASEQVGLELNTEKTSISSYLDTGLQI
jgi:hypothetical protein